MANLPLTEIVVPGSQDVLELAPDLSAEVSALQSAVNTLNTEVSSIPNGTYPNLTAGSILTDKYDTDTTPYLYRAMPYVSKRLEESLVGGSVVWNQLVDPQKRNYTPFSANGITIDYNNDGTWTINGTATASTSYLFTTPFNGIIGHKYLAVGYVKVGSNTGSFGFAGTSTDKGNGGIFNFADGYTNIRLNINSGDSFSSTKMRPVVIDLTAYFGNAAIADAIYAMEQATIGSGVAFMRKYFPDVFTAEYDTGTLKSVNPTAHKMVGVNAWDEEWEVGAYNASTGAKVTNNNCIRSKNLIKVLPNTRYFINAGYAVSCCYDADGNYLKSTPYANGPYTGTYYLDIPSDAYFITFNMTNAYGTTYKNDICINISDPTINGKYFPYEEHTYPLGDVVLRGIPKLVNNELIYDGDTYTYDGAVQRNTIFRAYQAGDESLANALTDGTNTVVYSANASTETTTPFEQYQICETGGTEEYTTTNDVPVGHDTKYFTDVIGNIEDIPAPPTADGTYTLKVTVSSGVPTYAWV